MLIRVLGISSLSMCLVCCTVGGRVVDFNLRYFSFIMLVEELSSEAYCLNSVNVFDYVSKMSTFIDFFLITEFLVLYVVKFDGSVN